MSRSALAIAVRDQLRAAVADGGAGLAAHECELAPFGGQPPPSAGERFAGVFTGGRTNKTPSAGLDETYGLTVVLTMRTGAVPFDRLGPEKMAKFSVGFDALSDLVRVVLARDLLTGCVQARANQAVRGYEADGTPIPVGDTTPRGFTTALLWLGDDDPQPVGGGWFHARANAKECGVVQRLRFGGMRRVQSFWDETTDHVGQVT